MSDADLSFSQRHGLADIPPQMVLGEIDNHVRARIWKLVRDSVLGEKVGSYFGPDWTQMWEEWCIKADNEFFLTNSFGFHDTLQVVRSLVVESPYNLILDFIEFIRNHDSCPFDLRYELPNVLIECRSAYRFVGRFILPISDEHEIQGAETAFAEIQLTDAQGVKSHLNRSAKMLRDGDWAGSIRESITAVESAALNAAPGTRMLKTALSELGNKGHLKHQALQDALNKLYGYTSDQQGIRHALVFEGEANVDEAEAVFMFGACASFVSYLLKISNAER
ncbi:AbiJ-NTD4 domain-containing protein [Parasphingorhabdus sp.]|uniref:AbiJ-NTD4 domain-containing protein n=1 Tax=Parasphingorhabdus sp. TaxID=2709688 RepID=UPI0030024159